MRQIGDTVYNFKLVGVPLPGSDRVHYYDQEGIPGQTSIMGQQTGGEFEQFVNSVVDSDNLDLYRLRFEIRGKSVWQGFTGGGNIP